MMIGETTLLGLDPVSIKSSRAGKAPVLFQHIGSLKVAQKKGAVRAVRVARPRPPL